MDSEPIFSSTDSSGEFDRGKPLRFSSVAALLLGVLSFLAPFTSFLWCIPAMAIVVAAVALRPTKVGDAGRGAAIAGLALALFFGGWAVAENRTARNAKIETARTFAQDWLDSFKTGETEFCYEMTLSHSHRNYEMYDLKEFHAEEPATEEESEEFERKHSFSDFLEEEPIDALVAAGKKPQWEFLGCQGLYQSYGNHDYSLRFADKSRTIPSPIDVELRSEPSVDGLNYWRISGHSYPEKK